MAELNYPNLTKQQRLAIFLIVIGPEAAADVLRELDDATIESLCREMSMFPVVPANVQAQAVEEFGGIVAQSMDSAFGGLGYAQRTLEIAKGDGQAAAIIGRVGPVGAPAGVIKDISEMEGRQIHNLIKAEQPQTIAFLLSYLDTAKAKEVFTHLSPELRDEVVERLGTLESTSPDLVAKIVRSLGRHFDPKGRPAFHRSGGVRAVADLLNLLDKETSKQLLAGLEERNAQLGSAIRKKMFSFEDLGRLQPSDLQRVLREVDSANLAVSMKSASEGIREKIYAAISKRAAESLRDEIGLLGQLRLKEVEAAREAVILVVRRLEEEGAITLENESAESLVA